MKSAQVAVEEMSYEQAFAELERVVAELEDGQASLEQALALFERAQSLAKRCADLLDQAELRIRRLSEMQVVAADQEDEQEQEE